MKGIFFAIVLVIAALFVYANYCEKPARPPETSQPAPGAPSSPAAAQQPAGQNVAGAKPTPNIAALLPRIEAVAKQVGVNVQGTKQVGRDLRVQVEWMGDVPSIGGDFVDQLYKQGIIRDFDDETGRPWVDEQGRQHFTQAYVLKF